MIPSVLKALKARFLHKVLGRPLEIRKSWEETPKDFQDMVAFLSWFNTTTSIAACCSKAASDWKYRFADHAYFDALPKGTALEIGFGGGRLLTQSAKTFERVYGVDIHGNFSMAQEFLASQGIGNATLLHRDRIGEIPDGSVDLVYSFIVFQHFDGLAEIDYYLDHIHRVLSPQGIAHIYFGKNRKKGVKVTPSTDFLLRDCTLFVNPEIMREHLGPRFSVMAFQDHLPLNPENNMGESAQATIVFRNA